MKIPSSRFIERAAENLGDDLAGLHQIGAKIAERLVEDTGRLTKKARYKLRNGANRALEIEDQVRAEFQTRPLPYLLVAAGLALVISCKFFLDRQKKDADLE